MQKRIPFQNPIKSDLRNDRRHFSSSKSFEVEMKFRYLPPLQTKLLDKGAKPLGKKEFTDIYFDTPDFALTTKDIWFRQRQNNWECKVGKRDANGVDRYQEITSPIEIQKFLETFFSKSPNKVLSSSVDTLMDQLHLNKFATIKTQRDKFELEGFVVDLDEMDFDYRIGEVELMVDRMEQSDLASQKILDFCRKFGLDNTPPIHGKVLEYIMRFRPDHYRALEDCGMIAQKVNHK
eukprot:TRINITY_DN6940_c0_g1_i1.p1 TRINITY_DN6940_c0_g1~~TRINITY_DN6940_c0_g1_i1.p1  ORF type:complete len:235 (+),score=51.19 TRINITY_DN6940_c0_g1_i1:1-705(+)